MNSPNTEIINITEKEYEVYKTLLKLGASTISDIARTAKLNQRSAYDYIERLISKGLAGQIIKNNKRMFLGLNPKMFTHYIEDQKKQILEDFEKLNNPKDADIKINTNIINKKNDLLKFIKKISEKCSIYIGENTEEITNNPNWKFFVSTNKHKTTKLAKNPNSELYSTAKIIAIINPNLFLIYSVPEESGFFIEDKEYIENMRRYFDENTN